MVNGPLCDQPLRSRAAQGLIGYAVALVGPNTYAGRGTLERGEQAPVRSASQEKNPLVPLRWGIGSALGRSCEKPRTDHVPKSAYGSRPANVGTKPSRVRMPSSEKITKRPQNVKHVRTKRSPNGVRNKLGAVLVTGVVPVTNHDDASVHGSHFSV